METIDPRDVKAVLTEEQLRRGAEGMLYRSQQLVFGTLVLLGRPMSRNDVGVLATNNALVESTIIHARSLAYFLREAHPSRGDLHHTHYSKSAWREASKRISVVAEPIITQTSRRLAHTSIGGREWEPHPDDWPLPEMAVVLSRGLADFVEALNAKHPDRAALFDQISLFEYEIITSGAPILGTPISPNPEVGNLTKTLQSYLAPSGWPGVTHSRASRPRT